MKIFGLGMPELVIILVVILIIFGPKNLPKLGSALGKGVKNLKDGMGVGKKDAKKKEAEKAESAEEAQAAAEELPTAVEAEVAEVEDAPAAEEAPKKRVVRVVKKTEDDAQE